VSYLFIAFILRPSSSHCGGCSIVPQSLDQATISTMSNGGPKYDAAYLKELKASTPTSRPPLPTNVDPYDADMSMDIGDISVQTIDMDAGT